VHGDFNIRAHAVLPDSVTDEELLHYANLMRQRNGEFVCLCGTKNELQNLTGSEAAELMKQKMSDGYDWRWRYTFVTATPRHFSFTVTFGRDGRVKDITDVWGWDQWTGGSSNAKNDRSTSCELQYLSGKYVLLEGGRGYLSARFSLVNIALTKRRSNSSRTTPKSKSVSSSDPRARRILDPALRM